MNKNNYLFYNIILRFKCNNNNNILAHKLLKKFRCIYFMY